ncbi:MAG: amidohydrolase family protein [Acidobacteria bacterium]|nr:amidohydrolase family protein [Acidobacteriota bacterium]MBI3282117.1 amidohydrolase family protein [Acidobacteriota bacterium]
MNRREFLLAATGAALHAQAREIIIDIHQHTNYSGRSDAELVKHQREMGVTRTVLLPAGRRYGLAAQAFGNDSVVALARQYPKEYVYFANELPDIPETREVLEKYLKMGALGIGEQKFPVECDSSHIDLVATIAREFNVPVLLHFEHGKYNTGIERFHKVLERHPRVNFIGHAQTWWGNIDKNHDQTVMYPKTKVVPGGITDRLLSDYANMYGDLAAGSGVNALGRDEDHAREFLKRHQDKLLFGSDCNDRQAGSDKCLGAKQIAQVRRLAPTPAIRRKILHQNASKLLKIKL